MPSACSWDKQHLLKICCAQIVYVGDGNNITHSWLRLAARLPFEFVCACPQGFEPDAATMQLVNDSGAGTAVISHDAMDVSPSLASLLSTLHISSCPGQRLVTDQVQVDMIPF